MFETIAIIFLIAVITLAIAALSDYDDLHEIKAWAFHWLVIVPAMVIIGLILAIAFPVQWPYVRLYEFFKKKKTYELKPRKLNKGEKVYPQHLIRSVIKELEKTYKVYDHNLILSDVVIPDSDITFLMLKYSNNVRFSRKKVGFHYYIHRIIT